MNIMRQGNIFYLFADNKYSAEIIYSGSKQHEQNKKFFSLNMKSFLWKQVQWG